MAMPDGVQTGPLDAIAASRRARFVALAAEQPGGAKVPMKELEAFFDELPAISSEAMIGEWLGGVFPVGGLYEFLLRPKPLARWYGKRFRSENRVDALMCRIFGMTVRLPLGRARLRRIEYRGVVSAAMIYDRLPIIDHFRAIDDDTLMGLMETRGRRGAAFYLTRNKG